MNKSKYIAPRGAIFYYLEVYDISQSREHKLSEIFQTNYILPKTYVGGTLSRLDIKKDLHLSLFWKNESSAKVRIESLLNTKKYHNYRFILKSINREEYLKVIPDDNENKLKYDITYQKNKKLKLKEIEYLNNINRNE